LKAMRQYMPSHMRKTITILFGHYDFMIRQELHKKIVLPADHKEHKRPPPPPTEHICTLMPVVVPECRTWQRPDTRFLELCGIQWMYYSTQDSLYASPNIHFMGMTFAKGVDTDLAPVRPFHDLTEQQRRVLATPNCPSYNTLVNLWRDKRSAWHLPALMTEFRSTAAMSQQDIPDAPVRYENSFDETISFIADVEHEETADEKRERHAREEEELATRLRDRIAGHVRDKTRKFEEEQEQYTKNQLKIAEYEWEGLSEEEVKQRREILTKKLEAQTEAARRKHDKAMKDDQEKYALDHEDDVVHMRRKQEKEYASYRKMVDKRTARYTELLARMTKDPALTVSQVTTMYKELVEADVARRERRKEATIAQ
jgi:hypothetical protein